ncbi:MAG TPA: serine hydrolase domain-containing protein [Pyrinomonadaceae bacterium]|jgi:CubicO group peptidase (beta-lactamase class C family)|nr:serine hydrolase domain-containing protein [Pyrinomonadaceae bacterium]
MKRACAISVLLALLLGLARAQDGTAQKPDPYADKVREFESYARAQMERDRVPGMTIGFSVGGHTWVQGFGYADLENKVPAKAESAYRLASVTKTMTGVAAVLLAERGKLNLDAEVQTYVPDYPKQQWPVTTRQLLAHLGGGQTGSGLGPEHVTTKEVVARISKFPIKQEPGTQFNYQTSGYNLVGAAIEGATGQSFETFLRENVWLPAGMKDTRMDDVVNLVPNRVRGYELVNGEIKNAPFIDVSSRFGGGGATGTVPDLLRWGRAVLLEGKILSPKSREEMLAPLTTKAGRFSGLGDGDEYYTLGWIVLTANGRHVVHNEGSQKGTETALFVFPGRDLVIAVACNRQFAPTDRYVRRLYETLTGESWSAALYTREQADSPIARALDGAYNYGAAYFEQHGRPLTADAKELAEAFAFFNANANREAARADAAAVMQRVRDARHPVGGQRLIKLGSFIASKLKAKNGAAGLDKYYARGSIPFFADYVRLYKADASVPKGLRFTPAFEKLLERWDADWSRTWNDYTRRLTLSPATDFGDVGARLRRDFAGAEVFPDFSGQLQPIQQGAAAFHAAKLGVDLYPHSDELLFNWGFFIILGEANEQARPLLKQLSPYERPVVYFKRAFAANPRGVMRPATFLDIAGRWLANPQMTDPGLEFVGAAVEVHEKNAALREMLGDFLLKKGRRDEAAESYRRAYALDPAVAKGATAEDYVARKLAGAAAKTN